MRNVAIILLAAFAAVLVCMHTFPQLVTRLHGMHAHAEVRREPGRSAAATEGTNTVAAAADEDAEGWPPTRAGELAHRWVESFNTGEKAMKGCLAEIMAGESLKKTKLPARVERYRDLRERFGTLTLVSVDRSEPFKVEVTLAASDLSQHHFTFTAEDTAPHKLLAVSMMEPHFGLHGFGH